MSTRSFIGFIDENDKFVGIYSHYDGYPSHVGKILVEHHNSHSAMEAIVYGPQIRNFDHDGTICRFGDGTPDDHEVYDSIDEALSSAFDYVYVFSDQDNCWKCFERDRLYNNVVHEVNIPGNQPWETA